MMAKIIKIRNITMNTFLSAGIDANSVLTTICSPSFLLITLSGRKARNALRAFRLLSEDVSLLEVDIVSPRSTNESQTMRKSRMFQPFIMYPSRPGKLFQKKPIATIFMMASMVNITVKMMSK